MKKRIDDGVVGHIIAWAFYGFMTFLVTILWTQEGHCAEKPKVELFATPKMSMAHPVEGSLITLRLVITNATEREWCPEIVWIWPDDTISSTESDCDPFDKADPKDIARQSWIKRIRVPSGDWTFAVELRKAGKTIRKVDATVKVQ